MSKCIGNNSWWFSLAWRDLMGVKVEGVHPDHMWHSQRGQIPESHPVLPGLCALRPLTQFRGQHPGMEGTCVACRSPGESWLWWKPSCVTEQAMVPALASVLSSAEWVLRHGQQVSNARLSLWWPPPPLIFIIFVLFFLITDITYIHENSDSTKIGNVLSEIHLLLRITSNSLLIFFVTMNFDIISSLQKSCKNSTKTLT